MLKNKVDGNKNKTTLEKATAVLNRLPYWSHNSGVNGIKRYYTTASGVSTCTLRHQSTSLGKSTLMSPYRARTSATLVKDNGSVPRASVTPSALLHLPVLRVRVTSSSSSSTNTHTRSAGQMRPFADPSHLV